MSYIQSNTVIPISSNTTLYPGDSGKIYSLLENAIPANYTVTLPAPTAASSMTFEFYIATTPADARVITIQSAGALPNMTVKKIILATPSENTVSSNIAFGAGAAGTKPSLGDFVKIVGNGTNYFAFGWASLAGSLVPG